MFRNGAWEVLKLGSFLWGLFAVALLGQFGEFGTGHAWQQLITKRKSQVVKF